MSGYICLLCLSLCLDVNQGMTMCGIVACVGENVGNLAVSGLQRMQYRGYDSYGFAWVNGENGQILTRRSIDSLDDLQDHLPTCSAVLGHTRWATHGGVSVENCHPHTATSGEFSLVHNGIVENYQDLKELNRAGTYVSETDTEVIVKLLEIALEQVGNRQQAFWKVLDQLCGRNTIVVLFVDGELLGVREGSPLVLGKSDKCPGITCSVTIGSDISQVDGNDTSESHPRSSSRSEFPQFRSKPHKECLLPGLRRRNHGKSPVTLGDFLFSGK